jgi:hopanoid-associated phosphorylase
MSPPSPVANILFVSGLKREAAILTEPGWMSICGDPSTLPDKLAQFADLPLQLVVSWGICGGLDPRLRPGDLVIGTEVISDRGHIVADESVMLSLQARLANAEAHAFVGRMSATRSPALTPRNKAELRTATKALAVDMESGLVGRFAIERRTPFAILRAVSDPADRNLPPLVLKAVDADGRINISAVIGNLIRSPGQFPGLIAAARDSSRAFRALGRCRRLPGLFLDLGLEHL